VFLNFGFTLKAYIFYVRKGNIKQASLGLLILERVNRFFTWRQRQLPLIMCHW